MLRCTFLVFTVLGSTDSGSADDVVHLTDSNFEHETQASTGMTTGDWFVMFHAPWCGHCKNAMPELLKFAKNVRGKTNVAAVDATAHQALARRFSIRGFPTFIFFSHSKQFEYGESRSALAFEKFVTEGYKKKEGKPVAKEVSFLVATMNEVLEEIGSLPKSYVIGAIAALLVGFAIGAVLSFKLIPCRDSCGAPEAGKAYASDTKKVD